MSAFAPKQKFASAQAVDNCISTLRGVQPNRVLYLLVAEIDLRELSFAEPVDPVALQLLSARIC